MAWSKDWPTEPGWYWAHGYLSEVPTPQTALVHVRRAAVGVTWKWGDMHLFPSGKDVRWHPVAIPDLPTDLEQGDDLAG